ncbi:MAG: hypothetical protein GY796_06225 [Chloroflexi bacterium]|nr:hypothetical protein [Chloroflexota bacterium]
MSGASAGSSPIGAVLQFVWDNFVQPNLARGATWGWKAAQWKRAADRYSQKLEQDYGKLFVLGQPVNMN